MTRHDVIRRIVERELRGESLREQAVLKDDEPLHASACEHFGTWETSLEYAGVDVRRTVYQGDDTQELLIRRLRYLCSGGYNLQPEKMRVRQPQLYRRVVQMFGSWEAALCAAKINPEGIHPYPRKQLPHRQQVLQMLADRKYAGLSLCWSEMCRENQALTLLAKRYFGSWQRALAAAGIVTADPTPRPGRKWSERLVVESLVRWYEANNRDNRASIWIREPKLATAAHRYFGSLDAAFAAAGIPPRSRRRK
jgi:hypothetical protein